MSATPTPTEHAEPAEQASQTLGVARRPAARTRRITGTAASGAAEPALAEPVLAEPVLAEPVLAEPVLAEPVLAEPVLAEPVLAEPVLAEPVLAEPVLAEPVLAEPVLAEPALTEPVLAEPALTEPALTEPALTEPALAEPAAAEPAAAEPAPAVPTQDGAARVDRSARRSHNATERAILAAARQAVDEEGYVRMTIEGIARRAFVSRTAVYHYFDNKRAVVDRLIQQAFSDMYQEAAIYLEGHGDPRRELHLALRRVVGVVNRDASVLLLAGWLSGMEDHLPPEWAPYIASFVTGAHARIKRDQERGIAPDDIPAELSAQALLAMVERQITTEIIKAGREASAHVRALAELWWRAVYSSPRDAYANSRGD